MGHGTSITTTLSFDEAVQRTRAALTEQGFGVLTEIDVQATMKKLRFLPSGSGRGREVAPAGGPDAIGAGRPARPEAPICSLELSS